jgi:hypothetical protein
MPIMAVRVRRIWSCPKRSLDSALETYRVPPVVLVDQEGEQVALASVLDGDKAVLVNRRVPIFPVNR